NDHHHRSRTLKDEVGASDHEYAGGHHRSRVDQCRDRRWSGHRVRKPDVERYLSALAGRTDKQAKRYPRHQSPLPEMFDRKYSRPLAHRADLKRPESHKHRHDRQRKPEVADPVYHKRLLRRVSGLFALKVVADQKVGTEPDPFPSDEHDHEV